VCLHCESASAQFSYCLCYECLSTISWVPREEVCQRCGRRRCVCYECRFRGSIKPAFEVDGCMPFLVEQSLKKRARVTTSLAAMLQGWELIRYISQFDPLEPRDKSLADILNKQRNKRTKLRASVTHCLTRKKQSLLSVTLQNRLLIVLQDLR